MKSYEGTLEPPSGARFAIVVSRFNHAITERLLEGALDGLRGHGVPDDSIAVAHTPGAIEIPLFAKRFAASKKFDAVIALGAVIRGATAHFDYVAGEVASGCTATALETGVPVIFGVLTTDTVEQAEERSGTKEGNKGFDAALAAVEVVSLSRLLGKDGI